jgi:hypothetical protein
MRKERKPEKSFPNAVDHRVPMKTGGVESKSKHPETILDDFKSQSPSHFA